MGKLISDGIFHEIEEGHYYATQKNWYAGVGPDDREVQLALYLEIVDMFDQTADRKFEEWPVVMDVSIMVAKPGPKWRKESGTEASDQEGRLYDSHTYGGGVPVAHTLMHGIKGGGFDLSKFGPDKVKWVNEKAMYGTVAAQQGRGASIRVPYFKHLGIALLFADELLKNAPAVFGLIGFILDRPINMAGDSGWSLITQQAK